MGGGYSLSGSQSIANSSGAKTGPITFGAVNFGSQGGGAGGSTSLLYLGLAGVAGLVAWFVLRR
jgi:hypothetical protein